MTRPRLTKCRTISGFISGIISWTICGTLYGTTALVATLALASIANAHPPYEGELSGYPPCFDANDGIDPRWAQDAAQKVLWGIINRKGEMVLSPQFDSIPATDKYQYYPTIKLNPYFKKDIFDKSGKTCIARGGKGVSVYCEYQGITMVDFHRTTMEKFFPQYIEQITPALRPFGACGYIDKNNRVLLPPVYTEASDFCNGHALVTWQGKRYLIDTSGKRIRDLGNLDFENFNDGLSIASDGQSKYFIDHNGNKVFGKTFVDARSYNDGTAPVAVAAPLVDKLKQLNRDKQLTIGFIDTTGKLVTSKEYVGARPFSEGLAAVRIGLNWGFIDKNGKVVIKPQYDQAQSFSDGLAPVRTGANWGYIDKTGKFVIKPQFRYCGETVMEDPKEHITAKRFTEGIAIAYLPNEGWRYIDKTGKALFDFRVERPQDELSEFHDGCAYQFDRDDKAKVQHMRFLDKTGKILWTPEAWLLAPYREGLAPMSFGKARTYRDKDFGYRDKHGKAVIGPNYCHARSFREGLAAVMISPTRWSFIDKKGKQITQLTFDDARDFYEGLASVEIKRKWGYINRQGRLVIKPTYSSVSEFCNGRAMVKIKDKYSYIDRSGKIIIKAQYSKALPFSDGRAMVTFTNKNFDLNSYFVYSQH